MTDKTEEQRDAEQREADKRAARKRDAGKQETVNGIKMEKGKLYLRDNRNGTVHEYQPMLAEMGYIERFIYGDEEDDEVLMGNVPVNIRMTTAERAAEYDRLARMTPEERAEENAKAGKPDSPPTAKEDGEPDVLPQEPASGDLSVSRTPIPMPDEPAPFVEGVPPQTSVPPPPPVSPQTATPAQPAGKPADEGNTRSATLPPKDDGKPVPPPPKKDK